MIEKIKAKKLKILLCKKIYRATLSGRYDKGIDGKSSVMEASRESCICGLDEIGQRNQTEIRY